jgi:hypothetical protein
MILYVNGDSHTAGAEAVNPYAFAEDDPNYTDLKKKPHPDNLAVSWSTKVAKHFDMKLICDAESGCSNHRILRTTKEFVDEYSKTKNRQELLVIIGWTTWFRVEWLIDGEYYQINNTGVGHLSYDLTDRYEEHIKNIDFEKDMLTWHKQIYKFSLELIQKGVKHIFFNCNNDFNEVVNIRYNWKHFFIGPYAWQNKTFDGYLKSKKIKHTGNYHYGNDGHKVWADYLIKHIEKNDILR